MKLPNWKMMLRLSSSGGGAETQLSLAPSPTMPASYREATFPAVSHQFLLEAKILNCPMAVHVVLSADARDFASWSAAWIETIEAIADVDTIEVVLRTRRGPGGRHDS
jgi:hypothetical protein